VAALFPRGHSLAFQKEEDMQEDMNTDEKVTQAGTFLREMDTMMKAVGDAGKREESRGLTRAKY